MNLITGITPITGLVAPLPLDAGGSAAGVAGGVDTTGQSGDAGSSTSSQGPGSAETGGLLQPNEFLTLLVDSLKYQDPLDPTSTSDFLTQLAALSQVQTQQQISSTDEMSAATALMGQTVAGSDLSGNPLSGTVDGVALTSSGPVLQIGTDSMDLSALTSVGSTPSSASGSTAAGADAPAGAPAPTGGGVPAETPATAAVAAGTPAPAAPIGTPAAGTPAAGTPAAGTPAAGTPAAGTPAAGTA